MEWTLQPTDTYSTKLEWFQKRQPGILLALLQNLEKCIEALEGHDAKPSQLTKYGHIRPERYRGLLAIDQRGAPRRVRETRLYILPIEETKTIHLITIGFKSTQQADLKMCREMVDEILEGGEGHGQAI